MILSNLPFDQEPLIEKYSKSDNLIFPYSDGDNVGIKVISKKDLMIRAQDFGKPFVQFIESLFEMTQTVRADFMFIAFAAKVGLCEILGSICEPKFYQKIDHKESYITDLTEAFKNHGGYKIEKNGYEKTEVLLKGVRCGNRNINMIGSDLRISNLIFDGYNKDLKENEMIFSSVFHALVAKRFQKKCNVNVSKIALLIKRKSSFAFFYN